ncbi:MAG: SIR2 family protein [Candidatus Methanoperedens sp.]
MNTATEQSKYPKEVFFLGSGASALAGVPTFSNFYEKAKDICKTKLISDESNKQFEYILKYWKKNYDKCNIEEFYSEVEMREMLVNDINERVEGSITTNKIEHFIYATINKSIEQDNYEHRRTYRLFSEKVTNKSVIITTNWDFLFETSSYHNLENGGINYLFEYPDEKIALDDSEQRFSVLKLHGSLNWGFCNICERIYLFNETVDDKLFNNELSCNKNNCKGTLSLIIVPPKLSKLIKPETNDIKKSPYLYLHKIWSKASEYVNNCESLYFIGYSFPETDTQMKTFFSNALRDHNNLKEIKVISNPKNGNSKIEFEERYISIFSRFINPSKIVFYYKGFKEFCNELDEYRLRHPPRQAGIESW